MFNNSLYSHFYQSNFDILCKKVFKEEFANTCRVNSKWSTRYGFNENTESKCYCLWPMGATVFFFKSWYIEGCVINMIIKYNPNKDINLQCKNGEKIFNIHINIYTR